jgi:hypothetical protein
MDMSTMLDIVVAGPTLKVTYKLKIDKKAVFFFILQNIF